MSMNKRLRDGSDIESGSDEHSENEQLEKNDEDSDDNDNEEYVNSRRKNKIINEFDDMTVLRKNACTQLFKYVKNKAHCAKIEAGIFKYTNKMCTKKLCFQAVYTGKLRDIIANMDPKSTIGNVNFVKNIANGTLMYNDAKLENYEDIAFMKPDELFPEKWESELNRKKIKEDKLKNIATSDAYQCRRCKKNRASVSPPIQLRSSDEPMTVFVTCLECGLVFKIN